MRSLLPLAARKPPARRGRNPERRPRDFYSSRYARLTPHLATRPIRPRRCPSRWQSTSRAPVRQSCRGRPSAPRRSLLPPARRAQAAPPYQIYVAAKRMPAARPDGIIHAAACPLSTGRSGTPPALTRNRQSRKRPKRTVCPDRTQPVSRQTARAAARSQRQAVQPGFPASSNRQRLPGKNGLARKGAGRPTRPAPCANIVGILRREPAPPSVSPPARIAPDSTPRLDSGSRLAVT